MWVSGSIPIYAISDAPYVLYYYDGSGNLIYMCENDLHAAAISATNWRITKYTYGANGITMIEKLVGSVAGRAALAWI